MSLRIKVVSILNKEFRNKPFQLKDLVSRLPSANYHSLQTLVASRLREAGVVTDVLDESGKKQSPRLYRFDPTGKPICERGHRVMPEAKVKLKPQVIGKNAAKELPTERGWIEEPEERTDISSSEMGASIIKYVNALKKETAEANIRIVDLELKIKNMQETQRAISKEKNSLIAEQKEMIEGLRKHVSKTKEPTFPLAELATIKGEQK